MSMYSIHPRMHQIAAIKKSSRDSMLALAISPHRELEGKVSNDLSIWII